MGEAPAVDLESSSRSLSSGVIGGSTVSSAGMTTSIPGTEWNLGRCFGNQGGSWSAGTRTGGPQCRRRPQRARSEVSCLGAPGPGRAGGLHLCWLP